MNQKLNSLRLFVEEAKELLLDTGKISEEEILSTVRALRKEKRAPEITVAAER